MISQILIVDANPDDRAAFASIMRAEGFLVDEAESGEQALEIAGSSPPALFVLEVTLPGIDGFGLCEQLKARLDTSAIPVVFLASRGEAEDRARGLELGAADYLVKPAETRELLARVRTQLQVGQLNASFEDLNTQLLKLSGDLLEKQRALEEDLAAAARIQHSLIPSDGQGLAGVETAWSFVPCDDVGGDVFNFMSLDERRVAFYVVDVTGHGVPSAMVTFSVAQTLAPHVGMTVGQGQEGVIASPKQVLEHLDREYPLERFEKPFTIVYLVLDLVSGEAVYSAAAHPPTVLIRPGDGVSLLEEGGPVIGMGEFLGFDEGKVVLRPGDRIFLYTDGITEQCNPKGELFGDDRFIELLDSPESSIQQVSDSVVRAVRAFSGSDAPRDDISLLAIEYRGIPRGEGDE